MSNLVCATARHIPLPDESVQCVVTSPPYWGLRKYSGNQDLVWDDGWHGAYGLEPTVEMYVQHTVEILREIRRVLRSDGVCFWNIGDSYAGGGNYRGVDSEKTLTSKQRSNREAQGLHQELGATKEKLTGSLKPKDLCLIPQRVVLAAQADGWWVRSNIIWVKPNPMPESITDRPTNSYENIIMLTKSAHYFWDKDAVSEAQAASSRERAKYGWHGRTDDMSGGARTGSTFKKMAEGDGLIQTIPENGRRNIRNVWTFPTQPYRGAHFAVFPEELPRRCIRAATSEHGACEKCGAPWARIIQTRKEPRGDCFGKKDSNCFDHGQAGSKYMKTIEWCTIGWQPTCECNEQKVRPCIVLDPFGGSGTTGRVATELRRRAILLDIAYTTDAYLELAQKRNEEVQTTLLLEG